MSKADEMFKKIGYKKKEDKFDIVYDYDNYFKIEFLKLSHTVRIRRKSKSWFKWQEYCGLHIDELQAINEKLKELGWNE